MDFPTSVPFPAELNAYRATVEPYLAHKLRQYGAIIVQGLNPNLSNEQLRRVLADALNTMAQQDAAAAPQRPLRLVIRHDCQSTGCGNPACYLCQYNPSRLCTRNVKQKYLIDDHLKAKCSAPLRVELVDDTGACATEGLLPGVQLEVHVLNGEKYKELCPDNTLLSIPSIKNCIINHHTKALLRREGMSEEALRVFLQLERGSATLSDLTLTTSSEALLSGKAPTFRLLVWAVEAHGEPVPHVTYVVSESFVVATKRVKHAIKSDIPSVGDHISKLQHIGKATVEKLMDLRQAFQEEGFDVRLPEKLIRVEKVGQFRELVEMSELNNDLKNKLRHVLKLSPDKWDEVCQHALSAVVPDFRNRVWWCHQLNLGLLYACKNGAIVVDTPLGIIRPGPTPDASRTVVPLQNLSPSDFQAIPRLKQSAVHNWYMTNHPNWDIVREDGDAGVGGMPLPAPAHLPALPPPAASPPGAVASPLMGALGPGVVPGQQPGFMPGGAAGAPGIGPGAPGPGAFGGDPMYGAAGLPYAQADGGTYGSINAGPGPGALGMQPPSMPMGPAAHRSSNSSPFAMLQQPSPHPQQQPQPPPQLPQQQQPVQVKSQLPQQHPGPGLVPAGPLEHQGPSSGGGAAAGGSGSGMVPSTGLMAAPSLSQGSGPGPASSGGSGHTAGRGSAFASSLMMVNNIADAFPKFPTGPGAAPAAPHTAGGPPGATGAHIAGGAPGGAAADGGVLAQGPGSLEGLEQMLVEGGMSLFNVNTLTGNDTFRSNDWLQQLHGAGGSLQQGLPGNNSYTMIDVGPTHDGGGGALLGDGAGGADSAAAGGAAGDPGLLGQVQVGAGGPGGHDLERRLSHKLNSMSLDLGDY